MLPGEDGYGILTRLKSSPDTKKHPCDHGYGKGCGI